MGRKKKKKKNCYDGFWLSKDMENMGYFFEFGCKYVRDWYNEDIDIIKFTEAFMRSGVRYEMETGHPTLMTQAAVDTLRVFVDVDCDKDLSPFKSDNEYEFCHLQLYWVGWIYAYIHYRADLLSKDLVEIFPVEFMLESYYTGHQLSSEGFYERARWKITEWRQKQKQNGQ